MNINIYYMYKYTSEHIAFITLYVNLPSYTVFNVPEKFKYQRWNKYNLYHVLIIEIVF